jgi:hypothetical protein
MGTDVAAQLSRRLPHLQAASTRVVTLQGNPRHNLTEPY